MADIIPFPTKEEDEPEKILIKMIVRDSGRISAWVSNDIETKEQIDWAKRMSFDVIYQVGDMLGCGEGEIIKGEKDEDEV